MASKSPEIRVHRNLSYRDAKDPSQTLDLYAPEGKDWPVLVFVHGGGWNTGDKSAVVHGTTPYADIGRFFASKGVGTAVINYRLIPHVPWRGQIEDVAGAVASVHRNAANEGGDPKRFFVAGHSAGAQLATRVALDPEPLKTEGLTGKIVSGVIAVSGAGYEISRETLSTRGGRWAYFERRFAQGDTTGTWAREVSVLRFVGHSAPPFLILYGSAEPQGFHQQSEMLAERLKAAGVGAKRVVLTSRDHIQTALDLSRAESLATRELFDFLRKN
jgi:acetyl esterase/lipase